MTHEQAHRILDRAKDGTTFPRRIIDQALWITGDLDAHEAVIFFEIKEIKNDKNQISS